MNSFLKTVGITMVASLALAACSGEQDQEVAQVTTASSTTSEQLPAETSAEDNSGGVDLAKLRSAYEQVLASPPQLDTLNHWPDEKFLGTYSYAIGEFNSDGRPDMLIRKDYMGWAPITMISTDANYNIIQATASLMEGAASAGGSRVSLTFNGTGDGVFQVGYQSVGTTGDSEQYRLMGTMPTMVAKRQVPVMPFPTDHIQPNWHQTTDPSGLDTLAQVAATFANASGPAAEPAAAAPEVAGTKLTGTLHHLTYQEALFGERDPNPGADRGDMYWILLLDAPTTVTGNIVSSSSNVRTETIDDGVLLTVGDYSQFEGQHVTITTPEVSGRFPSDTSVPLGMLRVSEVLDIRAS